MEPSGPLAYEVAGAAPLGALEEAEAEFEASTWVVQQWATVLGVASPEEYASAVRLAVESSALALGAWGRLLWLLLRPLINFIILVMPALRRAGFAAAHAAVTQPRTALLVEAAGLVLLVAVWRVVRLVRRGKYFMRASAAIDRRRKWFAAAVRRRSTRLAAALPHLAYAGACVAGSRLVGRLGWRPQLLALMLTAERPLSVGLPAIRTLFALSGGCDEQLAWLRYWVVWAAVQVVFGLLLSVPIVPSLVGSYLLPAVYRWIPAVQLLAKKLPFCWYLWLQLPGCRGVRLAYRAIALPLSRRAARAASLLPSLPAPLKAALTMVLLPVLGYERQAAIGEAMDECAVLCCGAIFLLTPTRIANVGLLLLALGNPMLRTAAAIAAMDDADEARAGDALLSPARGARGERALAPSRQPPASARLACMAQLRYWLSYALLRGALWLLHPLLRWVPLLTHMQLIAVLWLQLPFFRAATRLMAAAYRVVRPSGWYDRAALGDASGADDADAAPGTHAPRPNALYSAALTPKVARPSTASTPTGPRSPRDSRGPSRGPSSPKMPPAPAPASPPMHPASPIHGPSVAPIEGAGGGRPASPKGGGGGDRPEGWAPHDWD